MPVIYDTSTTTTQFGKRNFETSWFWRILPAGMRRRWWLFRVFDLIARYWPVPRNRSGLLVVRMDGIGDMVLFRQALDLHAEIFDVRNSDIIVLGTNPKTLEKQKYRSQKTIN